MENRYTMNTSGGSLCWLNPTFQLKLNIRFSAIVDLFYFDCIKNYITILKLPFLKVKSTFNL